MIPEPFRTLFAFGFIVSVVLFAIAFIVMAYLFITAREVTFDVDNHSPLPETKPDKKCNHSYAWSGSMPCTGRWQCIYCGKPEDETTFNGKPME